MRSIKSRLAKLRDDESGFSLTELLIVILLLAFVLSAVAAISDKTQSRAANDRERSVTLNTEIAGIQRMTTEIRRACALFPTTGAATKFYCGSTTAWAPGNSSCAASTNCVDFILPNRGPSPTFKRIVYDCSVADQANNGTTRCRRYATAATATVSGLTTSPTAGGAATASTFLRSITNSASAPDIFSYCLNTDFGAASCTAGTTPATAQVVRVTIDFARKGTRKNGLSGTVRLNDAVDLRNIDRDTSP